MRTPVHIRMHDCMCNQYTITHAWLHIRMCNHIRMHALLLRILLRMHYAYYYAYYYACITHALLLRMIACVTSILLRILLRMHYVTSILLRMCNHIRMHVHIRMHDYHWHQVISTDYRINNYQPLLTSPQGRMTNGWVPDSRACSVLERAQPSTPSTP